MFPVYLIVARVPETPIRSEDEIAELFLPELNQLCDEVVYRGSTIMSGGPFGASMFYRFRMRPKTATELAILIEYTQIPHHGFITAILKINDGMPGSPAMRLASPISFDDFECEWLDELPPPEVIPLNSADNEEHFEMQLRVKEVCTKVIEHLMKVEAENLVLRNRLELLKAVNDPQSIELKGDHKY